MLYGRTSHLSIIQNLCNSYISDNNSDNSTVFYIFDHSYNSDGDSDNYQNYRKLYRHYWKHRNLRWNYCNSQDLGYVCESAGSSFGISYWIFSAECSKILNNITIKYSTLEVSFIINGFSSKMDHSKKSNIVIAVEKGQISASVFWLDHTQNLYFQNGPFEMRIHYHQS